MKRTDQEVGGTILEDIIRISTVNFCPYWGEKEKNLQRIKGYIRTAAAEGADIIAFPEMSLTGYENEPDVKKPSKMQTRLAETIPGPATETIENLAVKYGVYVLIGMPERVISSSNTIYNTVAVLGPDGYVGKCRKIHIPFSENEWATPGDTPFLWETPWGKMSIAICYDAYAYPEIARFLAASGARILFNCSAMSTGARVPNNRTQLEDISITNGLVVVTANQAGPGIDCNYDGHSSIIGPSADQINAFYYAGFPFFDESGKEPEIYTATVDLGLASEFNMLPIFKKNPWTQQKDYAPEKYAGWFKALVD